MFCRSLFVLLTIVLSLLRFTDSDYLFGIFKLFSYDNVLCNMLYDYVFCIIFLLLRYLCYFHDYAFLKFLWLRFIWYLWVRFLWYFHDYVVYAISMTICSVRFVWLRFLWYFHDYVFYNIAMTTYSMKYLWLRFLWYFHHYVFYNIGINMFSMVFVTTFSIIFLWICFLKYFILLYVMWLS